MSLKKLLRFPAVYAVQYVLGIAIINLLVKVFHSNQKFAPLIATVTILPITFLLSRQLVRGSGKPAAVPATGAGDEGGGADAGDRNARERAGTANQPTSGDRSVEVPASKSSI